MTWTSPSDRTTGTLITAAMWNQMLGATGDIAFLYGSPACRVYHSANQSVSSGAALAALAFDSERFDTDGMHDTATNNSRITIQTAGVYAVAVGISWSGTSSGPYVTTIRLNATTDIAYQYTVYTSSPAPGAGLRYVLTAPPYKFAAADYVEVFVAQTTGGSLNVLATGNYSAEFAAAWLSSG